MGEIVEEIQGLLNVGFEEKQFNLGKWGRVDRCHLINSNKRIFLEIERGQSHPDTNVLKVWPYLYENRRVQVFLIQIFFPKCIKKNKSRVLLSEWIGNELKKRFHRRFHYFKIEVNGKNMKEMKKLKEEFDEFCRDN